ncbi:hypothetical protein IAT38_005647 [Cryptococcus sp. DSM 104549]
MRRLSPSTLRQRALPPILSRRILATSPTSARALQTSSSISFPRSTTARRTFAAASAPSTPSPSAPPASGPPASEDSTESSTDADEPVAPLPPHSTLAGLTTSVIKPTASGATLPDDLHSAFVHLNTAFVPRNQHLAADPSPSPFSHVIRPFPGGGPPHSVRRVGPGIEIEEHNEDEDEEPPMPETVMALASPFEGGEGYVRDAVGKMAGKMGADVVRLDLVLGLAFDGEASPLGADAAPALPHSLNPIYQPAPTSPYPSPPRKDTSDASEDDSQGGAVMGHMPIAVLGPAPPGLMGGSLGGGLGNSLGSLFGGSSPDEFLGPSQPTEEWVSFFSKLINAQTPDVPAGQQGPRRIILLEAPVAMSKTFPVWWPSFVEAVQRRRRGLKGNSRKKAKKGGEVEGEPKLVYPTTIVLQCTPSLALPHTAPVSFGLERDESDLHTDGEHEHEGEGEESQEEQDRADAAISAIEEKFRSMGFNVHHHVEEVKPREGAKLWWGSEEGDHKSRKEGEQARLKAMLSKGLASSLPSFDGKPEDTQSKPTNPLQRLLGHRLPQPQPRSESHPNATPLIWKAYPIIPQQRNLPAERESRTHHRRVYTAALLTRAVHQLGGVLVDPLQALVLSEATGLPLTRKTEPSSIGRGWGNAVVGWSDALHLASTALGLARIRAGQAPAEGNAPVEIHWKDIIAAKKEILEERLRVAEQAKRHYHPTPKREAKQSHASPSKGGDPAPTVDHVVENLKKSRDLSQHEKRLLGCIVDPTKLAATTFKDVHLPDKTVDGIRSMVSLPLLFPEAFRGGVLKDHATTGALLFGPPGTGKTLLARAVAAESGARMLAIQPSDVNDMYVGEGEKLVKSVFSLARRLSPCVVFLDEVDALFGARISRGSAGSMSHNLILTEFMQEMDGLSSAIANKDKKVVVVGATNRPFDLDDAVLRRLPRRLLVDLPGLEGRRAILQILLRDETLGEDVDLDRIAKETDGFSGSDLKHLCVSAAISAVKETVSVPWLTKQIASSDSPSTPTSTADSAPSTPPGGGGKAADVLVVEQGEGGGGRKKAKVTKQKAVSAPLASTSSPASASASTSAPAEPAAEEDELARPSSDLATQPLTSDSPSSPSDAPELLSADKSRATPPSAEDLVDAEEYGDVEEVKEEPKPRVLAYKHFKTALGEIRPSSSEEGSLPELRKWAEQFGEGGTKKGKKSGFGKGFGFGDLPLDDKGKGYGKVKEDE